MDKKSDFIWSDGNCIVFYKGVPFEVNPADLVTREQMVDDNGGWNLHEYERGRAEAQKDIEEATAFIDHLKCRIGVPTSTTETIRQIDAFLARIAKHGKGDGK